MKKQITNTLDSLMNIDLKNYPYDEIRNLISRLEKVGYIKTTFHVGKKIIRARLNGENEQFFSKCQLSYKPQQFNKTYQRASTPNKTMFYGSIFPENISESELDYMRITTALETSPWLRDDTSKGKRKITFGYWTVMKDINLIAIVHHKDFYERNHYTKELVDGFNSFIENFPELKNETIAVTDFFSKEFAKEKIEKDYDYILSAILTEIFCENGIDGVLYPSVRLNGEGFNVAITPEIADNNLELIGVTENVIYKNLKNIVIDNETFSFLYPRQLNFELKPVENIEKAGEKECLKIIGLDKIEG